MSECHEVMRAPSSFSNSPSLFQRWPTRSRSFPKSSAGCVPQGLTDISSDFDRICFPPTAPPPPYPTNLYRSDGPWIDVLDLLVREFLPTDLAELEAKKVLPEEEVGWWWW